MRAAWLCDMAITGADRPSPRLTVTPTTSTCSHARRTRFLADDSGLRCCQKECSRATPVLALLQSSPSTRRGGTATRHREDDDEAAVGRKTTPGAATLGHQLCAGRGRRPGRAALRLAEGQVQRPRLQHAQPLRAGHRPAVRDRRRSALQDPLRQGGEGGARALRPAHARRGLAFHGPALRLHPQAAGGHRALRRPPALQRAHQRPAQRRHPGRLLRADAGRALARRRALQLGQRALARARARLRHPDVQEPRAALVHRGPERVRDHHPPPGVAARGGPGALRRLQGRARAGGGGLQPRLHPRRQRGRRDHGLLRGQPDRGFMEMGSASKGGEHVPAGRGADTARFRGSLGISTERSTRFPMVRPRLGRYRSIRARPRAAPRRRAQAAWPRQGRKKQVSLALACSRRSGTRAQAGLAEALRSTPTADGTYIR